MNSKKELIEIAELLCSSESKIIAEGYHKLFQLTRVVEAVVCNQIAKHCTSMFVRNVLEVVGEVSFVDERKQGWIDLMNATNDPIKKLHFYCCHYVENGSNAITFKNILELIS